MIIYNEDRTFDEIVEFENRSKIFGYGIGGVTDEEVWEIAREYEEIPIFNNIYYNLLLGRAMDRYLEEYQFLKEENFNIYINDTDTHFDYIDNDRNIKYSIKNDFYSFEEQLEENKNILEEIENFKESKDLKDLIDLRNVIEYEYFDDNNIKLDYENFYEMQENLTEFLEEKYQFIDIPNNVLEDIMYNDYGENLKEIGAKVGYEFIVTKEHKLNKQGIELEDTGRFVDVNGKRYKLYRGKTFEDSQKLDEVLDSGKYKIHRLDEKEVGNIREKESKYNLENTKEENEDIFKSNNKNVFEEKTRDTVSQSMNNNNKTKEAKKKEQVKKKVKKKSKGLSL